MSPLSDTFEEEDAAALREAAAAGVPFLEYRDVEMSSPQTSGTGGWGTPGGGSRAFSWYSVGSGEQVGSPTGGYDRPSVSGIAEETREMPGHTGVPTKVNETALESGWRPGYLRRRVVLSFIAGFAALTVTLGILSAVDRANGGLGDGRGGASILWAYLPTISKRLHIPFSGIHTNPASLRRRRCPLGKTRVPSKALHSLDPPLAGFS